MVVPTLPTMLRVVLSTTFRRPLQIACHHFPMTNVVSLNNLKQRYIQDVCPLYARSGGTSTRITFLRFCWRDWRSSCLFHFNCIRKVSKKRRERFWIYYQGRTSQIWKNFLNYIWWRPTSSQAHLETKYESVQSRLGRIHIGLSCHIVHDSWLALLVVC
jgi:hypothetical protein